MNRLIYTWLFLSIGILVFVCRPSIAADEEQAADESAVEAADPKAVAKPADKQPIAKASDPLGSGVMITIEPNRDVGESVSQHDVVELLAVDKSFDWAKDITFRQEIWALEFKFKPVRMIMVDIPQPSGMMQRKLIWYMVYAVTNTGKAMVPVKEALSYEKDLSDKSEVYEIKSVDKPIRFIPEFLLEGHNRLKDGEGFAKFYPDRVIPVANAAIQIREGYSQKLLTSVEMCREIAVGQTVWGVATWEDIDPRVVQFSIYVIGLTNAYRWTDTPGEYKQGDPLGKGRRLMRKELKLNFWRPGDEYFEHEEEIRYGIPGRVDYEWVYR
jgi:hypothetical protein